MKSSRSVDNRAATAYVVATMSDQILVNGTYEEIDNLKFRILVNRIYNGYVFYTIKEIPPGAAYWYVVGMHDSSPIEVFLKYWRLVYEIEGFEV